MTHKKKSHKSWKNTFKSLDNYSPSDATFLWEPYIPLKTVTLIEGDGGLGKSWFTMAISAAVSLGGELPGQEKVTKGVVLLMSAEDDPSIQLRPRLETFGGDPKKVFIDENKFTFDETGLLTLKRNISKHQPRLVIIDPVIAYFELGTNMNHASDTRPLFKRLAEMASSHNCAIVVVRHLRKSGSDNINHRGMGSIDMTNSARSVMLVDRDLDDPKNTRVIMHNKSNYTAAGESLLYQIEKADQRPGARFIWRGIAEYDAHEYNLRRQKDAGAPNDKRTTAQAFLQELLSAGSKKQTEIESIASSVGIKPRTLARAKKELGVVSKKVGSSWKWKLPIIQPR